MNIDFKGRARMIFAALGGILFLVLQAIFPQLPFTEEQTIAFMVLIAGYIIGEGIGGRVIGQNLKTMLASQKFQALLAGLIVTLIRTFVPNFFISDDQLLALLIPVIAFMVGSGIQKKLNANVQAVRSLSDQ